MIIVSCLSCGKTFKTHKCWLKRGSGKFCSKKCVVIEQTQEMKDFRTECIKKAVKNGVKLGRKTTKILTKCKICNIDILSHPSSIRVTCSKECLKEHRKSYPKRTFKHSDASKIKMSITRKNSPPVGFIAKPKRGENHFRWRGGATSEGEKIRKSKEYIEWRTSVYTRDNFTCVFCGKVGGKLNADHIKPFSLYPELRLELSNGRTLCFNCHKKTDTYGFLFYNKNIKKYPNKNEDVELKF
jgi:hypothetical protein